VAGITIFVSVKTIEGILERMRKRIVLPKKVKTEKDD